MTQPVSTTNGNDHQEVLADFIVTTTKDENDGDFSAGDLSLREAIALANEQEGTDTIGFDSSLSGGTIALNSSQERELLIDDSLSITGLGQNNLTLDGGFIFQTASDINLTIEGLNIVGGKIDSFGNLILSNSTISETIALAGSSDNSAIISRGTTTITDSTIKDNSGGSNVGIVIESGTATIERSAITGNDATAQAQAGIIIRPDATVNISNSTIANNQGRSSAGIENAGGTVNITNSTIANNRGGLSSGGINNFLADGVVTITSSIIGNNTGGRNIGDISGDGEFISDGNNLISNGDDATGFINGVNGDLVGTNGDDPENPQLDGLIDAQLGELQNNGGSTETIALLEGSPAIDAGSNPNNLETDQRGEGFKRTVGNGTDIGAYEVQDGDGNETPSEFVVSTLEDENDGDFSAGDLSLREAIALANEQEGADTIGFDSSLSGGRITLTQNEPGGRPGVLLNQDLEITDSVTISGLGAENLTIDGANGGGGIFAITGNNNNEVTIEGLTIANGSRQRLFFNNPTSGGAIAVDSNNNLTLKDSVITGSSANNGGAVFNNGTTTIMGSIITNNASNGGTNAHDGVIANSGEMNLTNTNIQNNDGAGVFNSGVLNIDASIISDNSSSYSGGGILNRKTLTISNSILRNNSSEVNGGSIFNQERVTVTNTTINGNSANGGAGIENRGTFALSNSTVHNNSGMVGSGINNQDSGVLTVNNSTISDNFGGGIYNQNSATVTSSIIAGNTSYDITFTLLPSDFTGSIEDDVVGTVAFTSGGNNLIGSKDGFGDPSPGGFTNGENRDLVGTAENPLDPQLGELQDNGGATPTQALLADSPAIDAGSNPNNLTTDQRGEGFERTVGNGTDIGAYEVQDSDNDADPIKGTSGDDLLLVTVDDDAIEGLDGSDTLAGNTGDDNLSATGDRNILLGNEGNDTLFGLGGGNDSLVGGEGDDVIFTESGNSILIGGEGDDSLSSNGGNNIIQGNGGDDILISSAGGNILLGGAQSDRFNLFISDTADRDIDIIRDFQPGEDSILLTTNSGMGNATYDSATGALFLDDLQVAKLAAGLDIHPDDLM